MKYLLLSFIPLMALAAVLSAQTKRPLTVDDLWNMKRITQFSVSPDGKSIVYSLSSYSMETNKGNTDIYIMNSDGSNVRAVKNSAESETDPRFTPDGKYISYSMKNQLRMCRPDGSDDIQLTDLATGASSLRWSPDGKYFLFVSSVYPDCPDQESNRLRDEAKEKSKVKASVFTHLMYRHWDEWRNDKVSHLFLYDMEKKRYTDITKGLPYDCPPLALGSENDYTFSPDASEIAFTMNETNHVEVSTNNDIFTIKLSDIKWNESNTFTKISAGKGNDNQPVYSPDGKYIAYCSMERAGFEADRQRIMLYDRKSGLAKEYAAKLDRSAMQLLWSPDSKYIYFNAVNEGYIPVYKLDIAADKAIILTAEHNNDAFDISPDGTTIYLRQQWTNLPFEIFSISADGKETKQLTKVNKKLLSEIEMNPIETIWSDGAAGDKVQSVVVKPPFFDPSKKYPLIILAHGGPQGEWSDDFHYRWNLQLFASKGYVVVAPNIHGSIGYGQKFTDAVTLDWGGKPYEDIMKVTDDVTARFNFIDSKNIFAAGASYGGYMMNWIEGHTDRFSAIVSHDGVFNLESMYGTTEELWFNEWEYGGAPWKNREWYVKNSPHQFVKNFKTPMLVVQGANDFRVTEEQAFQLFTSLQRMGVDSKFLYFPDETHFVSKPQNARLWWTTIFDWFETHKK
jgi:dipeptidyl aminopeptidase/acylaminoacyl peptidase